MIELAAGFLPLTDCAILVAAKELGFAEEQGIALKLVKENSWANVRDRLAVEQFEIAHSLAPMPIAANLGLTPLPTKLIAPMALGLGGNAITVSKAVYHAMVAKGDHDAQDAAGAGALLAEVVAARALSGKRRLQFGVVHPFSAHNFELHYWLAASGIAPDRDVDIVVLPPSLLPDALAAGQIDGFCAGEPWNTLAVKAAVGKIATVKSAIWASSPEKVLAVNALWADENREALHALLRALHGASLWCSATENLAALAQLLSSSRYIDRPVDSILPGLNGRLLGARSTDTPAPFFDTFARAATFPWQSHALWFYSQMVRWRQVEHRAANVETARTSFRPDIYRAALAASGAAVPSANSKVEGALKTTTAVGVSAQSLFLGPDGFFDGAIFDPDEIDTYIAGQTARPK
tara:strand:- start:2002 stop:3222 length:1221 start_codon:yes stop_codon:yes gene_type:complete